MTTRAIRNEQERKELLRLIEQRALPMTVSIAKGAPRSIAQNVDLSPFHDMILHDVPGYEGQYEINRLGHVYSKPRYVNSPAAGGRRRIPGKRIRLSLVRGYPALQTKINGKRKTVYIHRVLAELFIPNPDNKPEINHKDGDKTNFDVKNLEWCSRKENMRHAFETGLVPYPKTGKGDVCAASKLSEAQVTEIKRRLFCGEPCKSIAPDFPVGESAIAEIKAGRSWGHVEL